MKWYAAEIIIEHASGRRTSQAIAERQIQVLRAPDRELAYQRALELGRTSYPSSAAGTRFVGLANLVELGEKRIADGTEVYSSLEYGNPKAPVRRKRDLSVFWFERNQKNRIARALLLLDARELVRGGKKGIKWYVTEIIVRCRVKGTPQGQTYYDRQIKVLRAADDEWAYRRALELGKQENHTYLNAAGAKVFCEFVGLAVLERLLGNRINDGTEVRSSLEPGDPKALVRRKRDLTVFGTNATSR